MKGLKIVLVTAMILTGITLTAQAGSRDGIIGKVQDLLGPTENKIENLPETKIEPLRNEINQGISNPQQPLVETQSFGIETVPPGPTDLSGSTKKIPDINIGTLDITTKTSDITTGNSIVTERKSSVTKMTSDITTVNPIEIPNINIGDNLLRR